MSDPQQPPPAYTPPVGAYTAGPTAYVAASGQAFAPAPVSTRSSALGVIALILALLALIISSALGAVAAFDIGRVLGLADPTLTRINSGADLSFLAPARDQVLWAEIGFWIGTGLGLWALIQGIAAIVRRRGRGAGIAAVVISVLAPGIFFGLLFLAFTLGLAAGAVGAVGL